MQLILGSLSECARDVDLEIWRRFLGLLTDGMRTRRDGPSPLQRAALGPEQTQSAMRAWRPSPR